MVLSSDGLLHQIIKGSALTTAGLLFAKLFGALFALLLARMLGPEGLGQFNLSVLLSSWFTVLGLFSIQTVVVQKMAEVEPSSQNFKKIISAALFMGVVLGLIVSGLHFALSGIIYLFFNKQASLLHIQLSSVIIFGGILFNTILGIERGFKHFGNYAILESGKAILTLVISAALLFIGYKVSAGIAALVVAPIVMSGTVIFGLSKYYDRDFCSKIIPMVKLGLPITLLSIAIVVLLNSDRLLLGALQSKADVGLYSVGITIVTFIGLFLPTAVKNTIFPFAVQTAAGNQIEKTRYLLKKMMIYYISLLGYIVLPLMLFRNEIIVLLFGENFIAAADLFAILLFAAVFMALYGLAHSFILSQNKVKEATIATLISIAVAIPLYIVLIARFGTIGACFATIISTGMLSVSYIIILKKAIRCNFKKIILLIAVVFLLMSAAFFSMESQIARAAYLFGLMAAHTVFLYVFGYFTKEIEIVAEKLKTSAAAGMIFKRLFKRQ